MEMRLHSAIWRGKLAAIKIKQHHYLFFTVVDTVVGVWENSRF